MDDLEATQSSFSPPKTQEELDALLESMGGARPTRTFGATLSATLKDELGNPIPVDAMGEPIFFEANPDYDPNAKPSLENFKNNVSGMAEGVKSGAQEFVSDPLGSVTDAVNAVGQSVYQTGKDFGERIQTGNTTLSDVFNTIGAMFGAGPATGVATQGVKSTAASLADPSTSRIFLTPGTPTLTPEMTDGLFDAKDMASKGVDALDIKKQTGWEKFAGKEWVYEIDDSQAHTKTSALHTGATKDFTFNLPGGRVTPKERQRLILEAQRDKINLKKDFDAGNLSEDMYKDLLKKRQEALENELTTPAVGRSVTKSKPLAPELKKRGKLSEVLYHPELEKFFPGFNNYTATVGTRKGPERKNSVVYGDHDRAQRHINVYKETPVGEYKNVLLHEVEHFVDDASKSMGTGSNKRQAAEVIDSAITKFSREMSALKPKADETLNWLNFHGNGSRKLSNLDLTDMIDVSLVTTRTKDGLGSVDFDFDIFKQMLKEAGNENPDLTFADIQANAPDVLEHIREIAKVRGGRNAFLSRRTPQEVYEHELGEVKARTVENRSKLTKEERSNSLATPDITVMDNKPITTDNIYIPEEYYFY